MRELCRTTPWRRAKGIRGVIFLDPYGMEVEWETVKAIAQTEALDVWYLFPLMGIYRQAAKNAVAIDDKKRALITRVLGTDEWEDAWYDTPVGQKDMFAHHQTAIRMVNVDTIESYVKSRLESVFKGGARTFSHPHQERCSTRIAVLCGLKPEGCKGRHEYCELHPQAARAARAPMMTQGCSS